MTLMEQIPVLASESELIRKAVQTACNRIAPTWPLDQFIAVNPYWGMIENPIQVASSRIESYSGSRMVMPRSFYRAQWRSGAFGMHQLQAALESSGLSISIDSLIECLESEPAPAPPVPLITSTVDAHRDLVHGMSISSFVTHNISQHCASYFDHYQSFWKVPHKKSLYQSWLQHARTDLSPRLLMGLNHDREHARSLPDAPIALIEETLRVLPVPEDARDHYLTAVLMSINGWASWCAYERWQAKLSHREDDKIVELLAIRLAWESYAFQHLFTTRELAEWESSWQLLRQSFNQAEQNNSIDWVFQEALEMAYQSTLSSALIGNHVESQSDSGIAPAVQAVFCIDVRSEVFRRALEACSNAIQTLGFAGFFGLPISYKPLGACAAQPQLPGLLAPRLNVSDSTGSESLDLNRKQARLRNLRRDSILKDFRSSASSIFTYVEAFGLLYASSLLRNTFHRPSSTTGSAHTGSTKHVTQTPCITLGDDGTSPLEGLCDLVAGILKNMSLTSNFARLVLFVGHGSGTMNNPHAAGLDCGACGGHSGEVNARLLANLLNDPSIRNGLHMRGIEVPPTTHFLAALHNTTTDEVDIYDEDRLPPTHVTDLDRTRQWLCEAGHRTRSERAALVDVDLQSARSPQELLHEFQIRSRDWSQVRPEWGLANNAAFLIAPRARSRGINLQGRVFLHEYQHNLDPDGSVLEAIMTAPMLVTNWINMQYYASTVDNRLYGCGNKVLHNVVGGRIGVFEGNGGDLRIGLSAQSIHDGKNLRHTPLRLSVFIEAPRNAISRVIQKHEIVRQLVDNSWLHLFQIEESRDAVYRYNAGSWEAETSALPEVSNAPA